MPITKTTSGLIVSETCEIQNGWVHAYGAHPTFGGITTGKVGNGLYTYFNGHPFGCTLYGTWHKTLNVGSGTGRRVHVWHKTYCDLNGGLGDWYRPVAFGIWAGSTSVPNNPIGDDGVGTTYHNWEKCSGDLSDSYIGDQDITMGWMSACAVYDLEQFAYNYVDELVICKSDSLTVTGLVAGQKVELFRSIDNVQVDTSKTVAGGVTSVTFALSAEAYPVNLYLKVYGSTGIILLETTTTYSMCGGDSWKWTQPEFLPLRVTSAQPIIYRAAAVAAPKTANIIATLLQSNGDPYVGKTVLLSTSLGSLSVTSGITDASGHVESELTGLRHGPAVIHAYYPGDCVVPASDELIVDLQAAHWTVGTGWAAPAGTLNKNAGGVGTAVPTPALYIVAGRIYRVVITLSACTVGSCSYTLGGTAGTTTLSSATTYTHYIVATNTGSLIFTPSASDSRFTISAVSMKEVLAANAYTTVHIFYEAEAPDSNKKFQFFCEGIEYPALTGSYAQNGEGIAEGFEVEIDRWYNTFAFFGLVSIYRLGVKEYVGRLLGGSRTLGTSPTVVLRGSDLSQLLSLRVVDYELYMSKTPLEIVTSLLSKYPCGLSPGTLNNTLIATAEFDSVSLTEALTNLCTLLGTTYRVNSDMTVDLDTSFGEVRDVAFTQGENIDHGELTLS